MDRSEDGLINDDGMQAPLLSDIENNEDFYRIAPASETRKDESYFIIINIIIFR
jgi:hypothetical protein